MNLNLNTGITTLSATPIAWWLIGLSEAGKTTLAQALAFDLRSVNRPVYIVDGDELRRGILKNLVFGTADREEPYLRVAEMAKLLNQIHIFIIVALISPTSAGRNEASKIIGETKMKAIYISTPRNICQQRDCKGRYAEAQHQNDLQLTRVHSPYEILIEPDDSIDTNILALEEAVCRLKKFHQN
ncbi:adenylyl-sulfate kinase [Undibacterium danionis]|uniref:Adenylyl-sulfate kinase n=1 Tax=Undibacterium danionis TaxID=1812100 RepID=A0ABV6IDA6_9BURK